MPLDLARNDRAWLQRTHACIGNVAPGRASIDERQADPFLWEVEAHDLERGSRPCWHVVGPPSRTACRRERRNMRQSFDSRFEFNKGAEFRHACDPARPYLADLEARGRGAPRIVEQLFRAQRDLASRLVYPQDLDGDVLAGGNDRACARNARPAHVRHVQQSLDAAPEIHEGAVVEHRDDASAEHGAGDDRLSDRFGARELLFLELRAPRDHERVPAISVLDDPERVGLAFVHGGIDRSGDVNLRERTERAFARNPDLVASFDLPFDLSLDGDSRRVCLFELPLGRRIAHALARQHDPAAGRHNLRREAVADGYLERPIGVLQFGHVDLRLAFPADTDERDFRPERDNSTLDRLSALEAARLYRGFEHCGKIFFVLAHGVLLFRLQTSLVTAQLHHSQSLERPPECGSTEVTEHTEQALTRRHGDTGN